MTDEITYCRSMDECRAIQERLIAQREELRAALMWLHETIEWHHERGIVPGIEPHSAVSEKIRTALGLPEGPYRWGEVRVRM